MAYTLTGRRKVEIIETPIFTKRIKEVLSDNEYRQLQWALAVNPVKTLIKYVKEGVV